jgi:hypothetical protein
MAGRAAMSLDYASRLRTSTDTRHGRVGESGVTALARWM